MNAKTNSTAETAMSTLTPFQRADVVRATKGLPRLVAGGYTLATALNEVLGCLPYPARAEREAAEAIVRAAYPGQTVPVDPPGQAKRSPTGEYLGLT